MLARRHALLTGQGPLARLHRRLAAAGRDDRAQGVCRVISALLGHLGCLVKNHRVICFGGNPCTVFAWQGANVGDARQIQRTCQSSSVMKPRGMAVKRSPAGTWDVPRWQRYCGWSCGDVGIQGDGTAVFQCTYCCFALTHRKSGGAVRRCCHARLHLGRGGHVSLRKQRHGRGFKDQKHMRVHAVRTESCRAFIARNTARGILHDWLQHARSTDNRGATRTERERFQQRHRHIPCDPSSMHTALESRLVVHTTHQLDP